MREPVNTHALSGANGARGGCACALHSLGVCQTGRRPRPPQTRQPQPGERDTDRSPQAKHRLWFTARAAGGKAWGLVFWATGFRDFEHNKGVQEVKKHLKVLSKKLNHLPDRCTLKSAQYNIHFISSLGLGYMMICSENYPNVLAFCFLDELQREFITLYDTMRINIAVRPYSFIEFDNFIQKTKQRYNNPRSLSTKINLADMQTEIKLRPSHQLTMLDVGTVNGNVHAHSTPSKGIAPNQRLEPVTLPGIISCLLCLLCAALNLIRAFHAMENVFQDDEEEFNNIAVFFIGTAACLYQCYLLACYSGRRNLKSFLMFGLVCLCNLYLHELRNTWQILFHVTVAAFATLQTRMRQPQGKAPDYNV